MNPGQSIILISRGLTRIWTWLCSAIPLLSLVPAGAAQEDLASGMMPFRLVDATTGTAVAEVRVVVPEKAASFLIFRKDVPLADPNKPEPQLSGFQTTSDREGRVTVPKQATERGVVVMGEQGVDFLLPNALANPPAPVAVSLKPWASLKGRLIRNGKPVNGAKLILQRQDASASIGSSISTQAAPICHSVSVLTGADGRFVFSRLFPTAIDFSRPVPYGLVEELPSDETAAADPTFWSLAGFPRNYGLGRVNLVPGESLFIEVDGAPIQATLVTGRFVWADGRPVSPAHDFRAEQKNGFRFQLSPAWGGPLTGWRITSDRENYPGEDGRFRRMVPFQGAWQLEVADFGLAQMTNTRLAGGGAKLLFTVPKLEGIDQPVVDLGDITLSGQPMPAEAKKERASGGIPATVQVFAHHKPLPGAQVEFDRLENHCNNSSRSLNSKGLSGAQTDAKGVAELKIPESLTDYEGRSWPVTHAMFRIQQPEYRSAVSPAVSVDAPQVVVALPPACRVRALVTLDGKPLPRAEAHFEADWTGRGDTFSYPNWTQEGEWPVNTKPEPGTWNLQVAHRAVAEGWRFFSDLKSLHLRAGEPLEVELPLSRGRRIAGRLDGRVPRPLQNAVVEILVVPDQPPSCTYSSNQIRWNDWQRTGEDGSFEFKGMPPGELWIAASCKGWISAKPDPDPAAAHFVPSSAANWSPAISMEWSARPVPSEASWDALTIPMVQTGDAEFTFRFEDGKPAAGYSLYWNAGLCCGLNHRNFMEGQLDHLLTRPQDNSRTTSRLIPEFFPNLRTDAQGKFRLSGLPPTQVRVALSDRGDGWNYLRSAKSLNRDFVHLHDWFAPFQVKIRGGETVAAEFQVRKAPSANF